MLIQLLPFAKSKKILVGSVGTISSSGNANATSVFGDYSGYFDTSISWSSNSAIITITALKDIQNLELHFNVFAYNLTTVCARKITIGSETPYNSNQGVTAFKNAYASTGGELIVKKDSIGAGTVITITHGKPSSSIVCGSYFYMTFN